MAYSGFNLLIYCGRNKDSADTMYLQSKVQSSYPAGLSLAAQSSEGQVIHGQLNQGQASIAHCTLAQL